MDPMQFLDILDGSLSEAELTALCRQFGVAYTAFPGGSKRDKAREFLGYIRRQGRMAGLAEATVVLRPDLAQPIAHLFAAKDQELVWLDQIAAGQGRTVESGVTWRWPAAPADPERPTQPQPAYQTLKATELPPNPYTPGMPITNQSMFFGRHSESEQLLAALRAKGHVAVVGSRQFGASSLLYRVAQPIAGDAQCLVAYVDMKLPAHHTVSGLLDAAWTQWWARVQPGKPAPVRNLAEFVTAVRKLNAAGYRPLLFLDELEQLLWRPDVFDDNLLAAWHELGRDGLLGLAVTAHATPADLFVHSDYSAPFHDLFQPLNLGLLDAAAARELLAAPPQAAGLSLPNGAVDHLLDRAGPHPFFLQLAGLYLFDALAEGVYSRAGVEVQFVAAAEPYWQEVWDSLSPLAQAHYPTGQVAHDRGVYARVGQDEGMAGRQLRILANRGLAAADAEGYRPFSQGFADWVARQRAATEAAALATAAPAVTAADTPPTASSRPAAG